MLPHILSLRSSILVLCRACVYGFMQAGPAGSLAIMQLDEKELRAYYDYKGLLHNSTAGEVKW